MACPVLLVVVVACANYISSNGLLLPVFEPILLLVIYAFI